jgi:hypothetical protein
VKPEKAFAEYVAHACAAATGRTLHHLFTGYLVPGAGEIKLLRETFNPLAMAQARLPNGAPISNHPAMRYTLSDRVRADSPKVQTAV